VIPVRSTTAVAAAAKASAASQAHSKIMKMIFNMRSFHFFLFYCIAAIATLVNKSTFVSSFSAAVPVPSPPYVKPPRQLFTNDATSSSLPKLYVYDHCPYCVRVRLALGLKNIKHQIIFLANDDIQTPTALIGKKLTPIFTYNPSNSPEDKPIIMNESLDIVSYIDSNECFGKTNIFSPATSRTDLKVWQDSVSDILRSLQRPRYVASGILPEFSQQDSRIAFITNHCLPPHTQASWGQESIATKLKLYHDALTISDENKSKAIAQVNAKLVELDSLIHCENCASGVGVGYDDIDLWSRLRSITIIKGVIWPRKLGKYMRKMSENGDVGLYDQIAI
jgi:glutaredoxin 2